MGEFELKFVWQFNHSWKFRSAYYVIAAEDIGFGSIDKNTILNLEAGGNEKVHQDKGENIEVCIQYSYMYLGKTTKKEICSNIQAKFYVPHNFTYYLD